MTRAAINDDVKIAKVSASAAGDHLDDLAALLHACVLDGASVGFVLPFAIADSVAFWRDRVLPGVAAGTSVMLVADVGDQLAGTVLLDCDTMPNQPHRAEVRKLLVHPAHRRRGIARALMAELERLAATHGRRLLTLDTRTGDSAEPLYAALGYRTSGVIPGYCLDPSADRLDPTTIMYKTL